MPPSVLLCGRSDWCVIFSSTNGVDWGRGEGGGNGGEFRAYLPRGENKYFLIINYLKTISNKKSLFVIQAIVQGYGFPSECVSSTNPLSPLSFLIRSCLLLPLYQNSRKMLHMNYVSQSNAEIILPWVNRLLHFGCLQIYAHPKIFPFYVTVI